MAEAVAAAAAAVGLAAPAGLFQYNRENFLEDRLQRQEAELFIMKYKIEQADQWRSDIRNLVSLTVFKMATYLLVLTLLLGGVIILFCEGRVPTWTPHWMMVGFCLGAGGALAFLLLSIWFAMHAAICAQAFRVRLLTQMVRLPIPSFQELEAVRTYGSEFEKLGAKQMFRVPWIMGKQENLLNHEGQAPADHDFEDEIPRNLIGGSRTADPWGKERRGDSVQGLGCPTGRDVASLRHIKLVRQAAGLYLSYDAFARVCMSVSVHQFCFALDYYIIAMNIVEVGTISAAFFGVVVSVIVQEFILRFDTSMTFPRRVALALLVAIGPLVSVLMAGIWVKRTVLAEDIADSVAPIAFVFHSLFILCLNRLTLLSPGERLPHAFSAVLYLDAFAWVGGPEARGSGTDRSDAGSVAAESMSVRSFSNFGPTAIQTYEGGSGGSLPTRPEDARPAGAPEDLRHAPGAPFVSAGGHASGEPCAREFYADSSWLSLVGEDEANSEESVDDEDHNVARTNLPYLVMHRLMVVLLLCWLGAAMYLFAQARDTLDLRTPGYIEENPRNKEKDEPGTSLFGPQSIVHPEVEGYSSLLRGPQQESRVNKQARRPRATEPPPLNLRPRFFDLITATVSGGSLPGSSLERLGFSWPDPSVFPRTISCDETGNHFVVSDGFSAYSGRLNVTDAHQNWLFAPKPRLVFASLAMLNLAGESVQDAAVKCKNGTSSSPSCEVLVLFRYGQRLATFPIRTEEENRASSFSETAISTTWLEEHMCSEGVCFEAEQPSSVLLDPKCQSGLSSSCAVVGTTRGRVVQLAESASQGLVPGAVVRDVPTREGKGRGTEDNAGIARAFNQRYIGALHHGRQTIEVIDGDLGWQLAGQMRLPMNLQVSGFCVGGSHAYLLTSGHEPQLWRMRLPEALRPETLQPFGPGI